mgnify:CR=1 FL=1
MDASCIGNAFTGDVPFSDSMLCCVHACVLADYLCAGQGTPEFKLDCATMRLGVLFYTRPSFGMHTHPRKPSSRRCISKCARMMACITWWLCLQGVRVRPKVQKVHSDRARTSCVVAALSQHLSNTSCMHLKLGIMLEHVFHPSKQDDQHTKLLG